MISLFSSFVEFLHFVHAVLMTFPNDLRTQKKLQLRMVPGKSEAQTYIFIRRKWPFLAA